MIQKRKTLYTKCFRDMFKVQLTDYFTDLLTSKIVKYIQDISQIERVFSDL